MGRAYKRWFPAPCSPIPGFQLFFPYMLLASVFFLLPVLFNPVIFLTSVMNIEGLNIPNRQRLPGVGEMALSSLLNLPSCVFLAGADWMTP